MVEPTVRWDVVVVGGINSDYVIRARELPRPGTSLDGDIFLASPGGKGANAAVAAARLGARTALIDCVGSDNRGRGHIETLAGEGVDVVHISVDARSPTGAAVIHVDGRGQKQILAALGANTRLSVEAVHAAGEVIRSSRVLLMQLEVPVDSIRAAARLAHDAGVRIVLAHSQQLRSVPRLVYRIAENSTPILNSWPAMEVRRPDIVVLGAEWPIRARRTCERRRDGRSRQATARHRHARAPRASGA